MKTKHYSAGQISYHYSPVYKKWAFKAENTPEYLFACAGQAMASKVANIINGAVRRTGSMDNMARANVFSVVHNNG